MGTNSFGRFRHPISIAPRFLWRKIGAHQKKNFFLHKIRGAMHFVFLNLPKKLMPRLKKNFFMKKKFFLVGTNFFGGYNFNSLTIFVFIREMFFREMAAFSKKSL